MDVHTAEVCSQPDAILASESAISERHKAQKRRCAGVCNMCGKQVLENLKSYKQSTT